MTTFIDPSKQTPLFTAQQVTCAYPISDLYASLPRYLYYALLVGCIFIRWHPWLSDVFLGAAATYAGVAAVEAFVLLAGHPKPSSVTHVGIPFLEPTSLPGNETYARLPNLVTNTDTLRLRPAVMDHDVDAILAIVVTSYLFMLPIHCFSSHVRSNNARHLLMALWNLLMLSATVCALVLWLRLGEVPYQFRFCYPGYPDLETVTNDGWLTDLWTGSWNSTIWNTFSDPDAANQLTENCIYPCFNTSQILRRPQSIVATLRTEHSLRTSNTISPSQLVYQTHLVFFIYTAIILSGCTAIFVLVLTMTGMHHYTTIPLRRPQLLWNNRVQIRNSFSCDFKNLFRSNKRMRFFQNESGTTATSVLDSAIKRRKSLVRLLMNITALMILFSMVVVIPTTWIVFVVWIEWWIHRDLVSSETPAQVGQWAPAVSVGLVLISALVLRLKYKFATKEETSSEIEELKNRLETLEVLRDGKS